MTHFCRNTLRVACTVTERAFPPQTHTYWPSTVTRSGSVDSHPMAQCSLQVGLPILLFSFTVTTCDSNHGVTVCVSIAFTPRVILNIMHLEWISPLITTIITYTCSYRIFVFAHLIIANNNYAFACTCAFSMNVVTFARGCFNNFSI